MSKVLIPLNNTNWGVIVNQNKPNEYEHVLSFENEEVKTSFIGEKLFNDRNFNYKEIIELTQDKPFIRKNDIEASVEINLNDVNQTINGYELKYSIDDLLNVDFLIVKEDDLILFYTVDSATRKGKNNVTVSYDLSLDVLFNYIDQLDITGDIVIGRAHTDRYELNPSTNKYEFIKENNWLREEALESFIPKKVTHKVDGYVKRSDFDNPDETKQIAFTWCIVAVSLKEEEEGVVFESKAHLSNFDDHGKKSRLPFKLFIFPFNFDFGQETRFQIKDNTGLVKDFGDGAYNKFRDDSNVISIKYLKGFPYNQGTFYETKRGDFDWDGYFIPETNTFDDDMAWYETNRCLEIKNLSYKNFRNVIFFNYDVDKPILKTFNEFKEIKNEVKLYLSQFKEIRLEGKNTSEPYVIKQEFIGITKYLEEIETFYKVAYQPTAYAQFISVNNYNLQDNEEMKIGLIDGGSLDIPWNSTKYNEYAAANKQGEAFGWANATMGSVGSIATGAGVGFIAGGPIGAAAGAAAGGVKSIIDTAMNLAGQGVMISDLKSTPNTPIIMGNNYMADMLTEASIRLKTLELIPEIKIKAYDFLYKYGYTIGRLGKYKDFIDTRYYFNFIQTGSIFSNINNRLSATIKQIINDTFQNGVTIWKVRDLDTFRGIVNYEYENQELWKIEEK